MLRALQWSLVNNKYYRNVRINPDTLSMLPEDGNLTDLRSVTVQSTADDQELPSAEDLNPYDAHLSRSFVPNTVQWLTEQETIRQSVQDQHSVRPSIAPPTLSWPPSGSTPINEFNTEGYISCAFPTLFPTGAADFIAPRLCAVTVGNYFKHLMMYEDGQFARHPRFRYFALNTEMRWRAL